MFGMLEKINRSEFARAVVTFIATTTVGNTLVDFGNTIRTTLSSAVDEGNAREIGRSVRKFLEKVRYVKEGREVDRIYSLMFDDLTLQHEGAGLFHETFLEELHLTQAGLLDLIREVIGYIELHHLSVDSQKVLQLKAATTTVADTTKN